MATATPTSHADPAGAPWTSIQDLLPPGLEDPVRAVRAGLPYAALERVQGVLGASDDLLARALAVSERTLTRRKKQGRLQVGESDRLLVLAEIVRLAVLALDDLEEARAWLLRPHTLLGGESPLARLDTVVGAEEVRTMLYHLEYAMPA